MDHAVAGGSYGGSQPDEQSTGSRSRARTCVRAQARVSWRLRAGNRWQSRMPLREEENQGKG